MPASEKRWSKKDKPNVVVFLTDQQRWDTSSLHGNPMDLMPNFERIARRGTHFSKCFTCQPVCGPARSSIQTGLYPTETRVYRNGPQLPEDIPTLAKYFNAAGYHTGYIGKWHLGGTRFSPMRNEQEPVPEARRGGYTDWLGADLLEFCSDAYDTVLYNESNEPVHLPGYRVDALTDAAVRWIDKRSRDQQQQQHQPFFLFLSFLEPHHQNTSDSFPAPDGYEEKYADCWVPPDLRELGGSSAYQLPGYYGMVKRLDECLGRVLDALKSLELEDDTIVLFTSDHGCHFKTRNAEYKRSCHESSIRIPAAAQGPGFDGGGEVSSLVSIADLAPSLMEAAGIPQDLLERKMAMQGSSVMPLVRGDGKREPWEDTVFIQISESQVGRAVRTQRWKYGVTAPDKDPHADACSKRYEEEFLYDLKHDPYELVNLIGMDVYRPAADRLKEALKAWLIEIESIDAEITDAPVRETPGQRVITDADLPMNAVEWSGRNG